MRRIRAIKQISAILLRSRHLDHDRLDPRELFSLVFTFLVILSLFFPMNMILLNAVLLKHLADVDFFATLTLTNVNSSLKRLILDEIITVALMKQFLRENQSALCHDVDNRNFSSDERVLIVRAFTALQQRNPEHLYEETKEYLPQLIRRYPISMFWNSDMIADSKIYSLSSMELEIQKQMHAVYTAERGSAQDKWFTILRAEDLDRLKYLYETVLKRLYTNNFHDWGWDLGRLVCSTFIRSGKSRHPGIKEELLFCGRIINDLIAAEKPRQQVRSNCHIYGSDLSEIVDTIEQYESKLSNVCDRKSEVNGFMEFIFEQRGLRIAFGNRGEVSEQKIRTLHLQRWKSRHPSELGFWFFRTCCKMNPEELFASKREAVVWTVLGAHYQIELFFPTVCYFCDTYASKNFEDMISQLHQEDKVWAMRQIVRLASEFAQCCFMGKYLYENFVVGDIEPDNMLSILLHEVLDSRIGYTLLRAMGTRGPYMSTKYLASDLPLQKTQVYLSKIRERFQGEKNIEFQRFLESITRHS